MLHNVSDVTSCSLETLLQALRCRFGLNRAVSTVDSSTFLEDIEKFRIQAGYLELVDVSKCSLRRVCVTPVTSNSSHEFASILYKRPGTWRALRLCQITIPKAVHRTLLQAYEPHFSQPESTFPSQLATPTILEAPIADGNSHCMHIELHLDFALGTVRDAFTAHACID